MNHDDAANQQLVPLVLHGKLTADGRLSEPDIYVILEKWLERHPEFRSREKEFRIVVGSMHLAGGVRTDLVRVTSELQGQR